MPPAAPQCTPEKDPRPPHGPQNLLRPAVPSVWKAVSPLGPGHPAHLSLQPLGVDLDGSMGWGCSKARPGGSKGDGHPALGHRPSSGTLVLLLPPFPQQDVRGGPCGRGSDLKDCWVHFFSPLPPRSVRSPRAPGPSGAPGSGTEPKTDSPSLRKGEG